jgi:chromate transport protein ChrA
MMNREKLSFIVTVLIAITLCICLLAIVFALLLGLYDNRVDNAEVFKQLSPALMTIIGAAVGVLAGAKLQSNDKDCNGKT